MGTWWRRTVESLQDYIEVYGWADPTSTLPPVWAENERDHPPDSMIGDGCERDRGSAGSSAA